MNEELLIDYASQTLANQKLANLFTFKNSENIDIEKMVFEWNEILNEKNMYVEILITINLPPKFMHTDLTS